MPVLKECEVCGREAHSLFRRKIEGVLMEVCNDCKDVGEEPEYERSSRSPTRNVSKFRKIYSPKKPDVDFNKKIGKLISDNLI